MKTLLLVALLASCAGAQPVARRDVAYGSDPAQTLDVYAPPAPPAKGRFPVLIWVHGGGWASGDKTDTIGPKAAACVEHGMILVSVNYRLLWVPRAHPGVNRPAVGVADIERDVARGVAWVRGHIAEAGGDPDFLFLAGHSAGAQLVALLCTDLHYLQDAGVPPQSIRGCVPVDGDTYYPALQIDSAVPRQAAGYRLKFPEGPAQRELSAVAHVAAGGPIPPFLLLHVTDFPETGTDIQARILAQVLRKHGYAATECGAPGKTHLTIDADLGKPGDPATQAMFNFFDAQVWRASYSHWSQSVRLDRP